MAQCAAIFCLQILVSIPLLASTPQDTINGALAVTSISVQPEHSNYVARFTVTCYSTVPISAFAVTFTATADDGAVTTQTHALDMVSTIPLAGTEVRSAFHLHLGPLRTGDSDEFTAFAGTVAGHKSPVVHAEVTGVIFDDGRWIALNAVAQRRIEGTFWMRDHELHEYSDQLATLRAMKAAGRPASEIVAALRDRSRQRNPQSVEMSMNELDLAEKNAKFRSETEDGALRRYDARLEGLVDAYRSHVRKGEQIQ
jgi:hypothetical protein